MSTITQRWAILDCSKYPSEKNCQIKMMSPEDQVDELIELGVSHGMKCHGHQNKSELEEVIRTMVEFQDK